LPTALQPGSKGGGRSAFRKAMAQIGAEPFYPGPEGAAVFVRNDFDKWAELIQRANIEVN
jgi:hypothetical protein